MGAVIEDIDTGKHDVDHVRRIYKHSDFRVRT